MNFASNPINVTVENDGIKKSDNFVLFPADNIGSNEQVGELFNCGIDLIN